MTSRLRNLARSFLAVAFLAMAGRGATAADGLTNAPTLKRPTSAEGMPSSDGFIQRWLILEPIAAGGLTDGAVQTLVRKEHFPDPFTRLPREGEQVTATGAERTWHAVESTEYNVNLFHFARALGKPTSNVLFWGVTVVHCPEEVKDVRLAIGSNAASVWWVNGGEVIGIYGDRQTVIDDGVSRRLTLQRGANVVRFAVVNGGGATDFCARFLDAHDQPLKGFTIRLSEESNGAPSTR